MSQWANIPIDDYEEIMKIPDKDIELHADKVLHVQQNEFQEVLKIWNKLPESQWETLKLMGRDMPEWIDLRNVLIAFRKAIRKIKKLPKKVTYAEGQPAIVLE